MAVMIFSFFWDQRLDYLLQKKLFHWKKMKLIVLRLSHRYLKVTHSYWISISFLNLTFMEFFQYLGVRLSTLRLPKGLQQMASHALIALLSQLRPESHSENLDLSEDVPPAEESVVEGLIERSQGTQTRVPLHRSQSQFLFRMHTVIEPPGRQIGKIVKNLNKSCHTCSAAPRAVLSSLRRPTPAGLPSCCRGEREPSNPLSTTTRTSLCTPLWGRISELASEYLPHRRCTRSWECSFGLSCSHCCRARGTFRMPTTLLSLLKKHKRSFLYKLLVPRELQNQLYDFSPIRFSEKISRLPPGLLSRRDSLCTLEPSPFVRCTALCSAASFRTNFPSRRFSVEMNIKISSEILQISPLNCFFYGYSSK